LAAESRDREFTRSYNGGTGVTRLIGIMGAKQAGKNTVGTLMVDALRAHGYTADHMGFADPIRSMMLALDPIVKFDVEEVYEFGSECPEVITHQTRYSEAVEWYRYEGAKEIDEVRRLLQKFGTEVVRDHLGENVWVDHLFNRANESGLDFVIITDVRFPNEHDEQTNLA